MFYVFFSIVSSWLEMETMICMINCWCLVYKKSPWRWTLSSVRTSNALWTRWPNFETLLTALERPAVILAIGSPFSSFSSNDLMDNWQLWLFALNWIFAFELNIAFIVILKPWQITSQISCVCYILNIGLELNMKLIIITYWNFCVLIDWYVVYKYAALARIQWKIFNLITHKSCQCFFLLENLVNNKQCDKSLFTLLRFTFKTNFGKRTEP